jgi:hypothetical protein
VFESEKNTVINSTPLFKLYTDKKERKNFLIYEEIQSGSGAKSYMRKGFLKYGESTNI